METQSAAGMPRPAARLAFHGLLVLSLGLVLGTVLLLYMTQGLDLRPLLDHAAFALPGTERGWRAAHLGCLSNGMLALLLAAAASRLSLTEREQQRLFWGGATAAWGNAIFFLGAAAAPNRALSAVENQFGPATPLGLTGFLAGLIAVAGLVVALIALGQGLRRAMA